MKFYVRSKELHITVADEEAPELLMFISQTTDNSYMAELAAGLKAFLDKVNPAPEDHSGTER